MTTDIDIYWDFFLFVCAACNVLYLYTLDTESLTGPQAVKKAVHHMFSTRPLPTATVVHFKVSGQGITLTDNKRQLFFRRHYPVATISYCGLDPDDHRWSQKSDETGMPISSKWVLGDLERGITPGMAWSSFEVMKYKEFEV